MDWGKTLNITANTVAGFKRIGFHVVVIGSVALRLNFEEKLSPIQVPISHINLLVFNDLRKIKDRLKGQLFLQKDPENPTENGGKVLRYIYKGGNASDIVVKLHFGKT